MEIIWKDIDYRYEVSNDGSVRNKKNNKVLKPQKIGNYLAVYIWNDKTGKQKWSYIHRLVAEAFIPNPDNLPQVNHKDENPENNHVENLEWCDAKYNNNYGTSIERKSKWVIQLNKNNEILHFYPSAIQASRETGIGQGSISNVCVGRRKSAGGFLWKYAV